MDAANEKLVQKVNFWFRRLAPVCRVIGMLTVSSTGSASCGAGASAGWGVSPVPSKPAAARASMIFCMVAASVFSSQVIVPSFSTVIPSIQ